MCCHHAAAPSLWLLGYPDQAVASIQAALALAQQLAHPLSLTLALYWAAVLHHLRREAPLTQAHAEAAMTIATDQEFPEQLARAMPLRGWALAASGHGEEGITQIQQGLAAYQARGRAYGRITWPCSPRRPPRWGRPPRGWRRWPRRWRQWPNSTVRWWEAELHRLRGELLLQHAVAQPEEAEACFQRGPRRGSPPAGQILELRAAMSLSRLWQHQGKRPEARELLAPVYDWFTEGFDTADLQEAKALLEELAG